jgi:hypothetical protein
VIRGIPLDPVMRPPAIACRYDDARVDEELYAMCFRCT